MTDATVSIAMCTYNSSLYAGEQLESIATQLRLPAELVICDDGSGDETPQILEKFRKEAPFDVRVYKNVANLGVAKNFEQAISLCSGDIIALADCDDIWRRDKLQWICGVLDEHPEAGYAFSDGELIGPDGTSLGGRMWDRPPLRQLQRGFPPEAQVCSLLQLPMITGATMAMRSSLKRFALPIAKYWIHDYWISLVAAFVGCYGIAIKEPLLKYRAHASQTIGLHKSPWERRRASFARRIEPWPEHIAAFQGLRERLLGDVFLSSRCKSHELELLEQKLAHLSERARARSSKPLEKYKIILAEALTGRYQRFSLSWWSIVRDLCP